MKSGVLCSSEYMFDIRMNTVDELKQCLVGVWHSLQQNVIDATSVSRENNRECACMQIDNILIIYCELVMRQKML